MTPDAPLDEVGIAIDAMQPSGAAVGMVDDAGERSAGLVGKRVLVPAYEPCGQCELCRHGGVAVCPLAKRRDVAQRTRASARWLVALGDGLELPLPAAAAVPGDVATAYTLYARAGLGPRVPAVVTGATAVTRFLVDILVAKSITPTVLADDDTAWTDWLRARGAAVAHDPDGVRAAIAAQGLGARPWRILATGGLARAAALAGPRATLAALVDPAPAPAEGSPASPGSIDALALLAREVTLVGVAGAHPDLIVEAAAMCVKGEIDLPGGVTADPADRTRALIVTSR